MHQLPLDVTDGGMRIQRATWAGTGIRVLELPPGAQLGHGESEASLCPTAHWGYVLEGSIDVRFAFGERETARAGDLYYWPALHTCWTDEGVRCLEFSREREVDA